MRDLPQHNRREYVKKIVRQEESFDFDLEVGPLLRVRLIRLGQDSGILIVNVHHIVSDGWSMAIFYRELSFFYKAHLSSKTVSFPISQVSYHDAVGIQLSALTDETVERQTAYWAGQLANTPAVVTLPTDWPRQKKMSFSGHSISFRFNSNLTQRLRLKCRAKGVTLFMLLLSAFGAVLFRYSGQKDIIVGVPTSNRKHTKLEDVVGFFANVVCIRAKLHGNLAFDDLLDQIRRVSLEAYEHQDLPFGDLVGAMAPVRDLSLSPLFQVMFIFLFDPIAQLTIPNVEIQTVAATNESTSKYDLTLKIFESDKELGGIFEYSTELFRRETVENIQKSFESILKDVLLHPSKILAELRIVDTES